RRKFGQKPLLHVLPELEVGQVLVVHDDQQVEVREVAPHRIMDPVAARVAAEQDDLEDATVLQTVGAACGDGPGEAVLDDLDGGVEFTLFRERQFPQRTFHARSLRNAEPTRKSRNAPISVYLGYSPHYPLWARVP